MVDRNLKSLSYILFKDPGIVLAIGNVLLFSQVNAVSCLVISLALTAIIFSKAMLIIDSRTTKNATQNKITKYLQKKYIGLELMGYACLLVAILAVIERSVHGLVCGLCFGFANLILSAKFENFSQKETQKDCSFFEDCNSPAKVIFTLLREPIVLIAIGMIMSGLSAGGQSIITLPLMIAAPAVVILKPNSNRAIPQAIFGISSIWYVIVGFGNGEILATLANLCFATAFFIVAANENSIFNNKK